MYGGGSEGGYEEWRSSVEFESGVLTLGEGAEPDEAAGEKEEIEDRVAL